VKRMGNLRYLMAKMDQHWLAKMLGGGLARDPADFAFALFRPIREPLSDSEEINPYLHD
jgi:hypothetical protein